MSIQYKDNTFSMNMDLNEAVKQFQNEINDGILVKALFVGTESELKEIKAEQNIKNRIDELEKKVEKMEKPQSDLIIIPTEAEIKSIK